VSAAGILADGLDNFQASKHTNLNALQELEEFVLIHRHVLHARQYAKTCCERVGFGVSVFTVTTEGEPEGNIDKFQEKKKEFEGRQQS
jgi:hypothetical protein